MTTQEKEPHLERRLALLGQHPEIRALYGYDPRPALITVVVIAVQLAVAALLQHRADLDAPWSSLWFVTVVAYGFGAFLNHWGGVVIHEASHNLVARTSLQNRLIALMANFSTPVPSAMSFRRYHLAHHRYLGSQTRDNDLPMAFEVKWLSGSRAAKASWLFFYPFFAVLARGFLKRPSGWEMIGFVVQMTVNVLICTLLGWTAMSYLLLSTLFAYGLHPIAGHFIHEHYLWNEQQETYSYYGVLNALTWNMGYHNEHHDFVRVPGSRLPRLHAIASDTYGALDAHNSWTQILLEFINNPRIGHHSRIVRQDAGAQHRQARPERAQWSQKSRRARAGDGDGVGRRGAATRADQVGIPSDGARRAALGADAERSQLHQKLRLPTFGKVAGSGSVDE